MNDVYERPARYIPGGDALHYLWEVAQKPVAVRVSLPLADKLGREAAAVVRLVSAIGSEIGGLLLGTVSPGAPTVVTVDDFELIPCTHGSGPLYNLFEADLERLDRAIAARASSGSRLEVVGFFRSHTRKGLALDAADIALCAARFNKPHQIALLVQPSFVGANRAGIFIWEDGTMRGEATYREFPFSSKDLIRLGTVVSTPVAARVNRPSERRSPGEVPSVAETAAETPKRAPIVTIATRREVEPLPTPPPPALEERQDPVAERTGLRARVGRCSEKVQIRADRLPTEKSQSRADGPIPPKARR